MRFRPCSDIHNGKVKQIVGGSLRAEGDAARENFVSEADAAFYAEFYKKDDLRGGHIILLNPETSPHYEATKEQAYAQLVKTTNALCDYAAEKGLGVELEVFDYDVDKAALIGPAPLAARFAADVCSRHNNFGLIVDLSHIPITHENTRFVIRTLRPYITHFHYGNAVADPNCDGYGDKHPRFGYPNSANDTKELLDFLRILKEEGFFNAENPCILSAEVTLRPGEDEQIVLANTKRVLNRAWALLED